jgi:hypothetical protein
MLIDGDKLIRQQFRIREKAEITFEDGRQTTLAPVSRLPETDDESRRVSLAGNWQASRWPFSSGVEPLVAPDCDDGKWETLAQPGKVFYGDPEEDGSHTPDWNRVTLAHIDPEDGAVLRKRVSIPATWQGKRIHLRFNAVYPAGRFWLNGKYLGEHLSGLSPVEWDVTDLVKPGEDAVVAVRLLRRHAHVQLDMPRHALEFAGLAQEAFFHATEPVCIADYHLVNEVELKSLLGTLQGKVLIRNTTAAKKHIVLNLTLRNPRSGLIATVTKEADVGGGSDMSLPVTLKLKNAELWNDEFPNLYDVFLDLTVNGQERSRLAYRTGFRKFELKNQRPFLNGNPVKFRGVNHLTYHPEYGLHTPEAWLRQCLTLMKHANVNCIRTHFTGPKALANLCDELGIYLMQELPVDWGTHFIHDPEWVGPALHRLESLVRRDRHHPSVMVWSVGNENMPESAAVAEDGWNHLRIFDKLVKTLDPTRPTMFPPPGPANKIKGIFEVRHGDIADIHYSFKQIEEIRKTGKITNPNSWEADMKTLTRAEALKRGWSGVWFSSEYGIFNHQPDLLNAPYLLIINDLPEDPLCGKNSQQGFIDRMRREWGLMRDDPSCLGGAYFPWLCSGTGDNPWGWVRWGEDADWGVVTADLLPKPAFWALRVLFSPVQFSRRVIWKKGEKNIKVDLRNLYNQIDLKDCTLRVMMGKGGNYMGQMRMWKDIPVACAPGKKKTITIPLWNQPTREALESGAPIVCRCTVLDPTGFRPLTHDIIVVPEKRAKVDDIMPIGPDAIL